MSSESCPETPVREIASENATPAQDRILSVDVLRGFDMFWLVGGAGLAIGIIKLFGPGVQDLLLPQLEHADWEGFRFYDLIFPLFVFMVGMALTFSLGKQQAQYGMWGAHKRLFRRFILMFLMGLIYYGGVSKGFDQIRWLGVLQRLALCYLFAGVLFLHFKPRSLAFICASLLLGYWAWLSFIPVPGLGHASVEESANWPRYIDSIVLPGRRHFGEWDPEGLLSTIPAIASCLLGAFAGMIVKTKALSNSRKFFCLLAASLVLLAAGFLWGLQFPIIKKLWTSSYVLVAAGYSTLLLAFFLLIVDILKIRFWIAPFLWIGSNSLTIYMARNIVNFNDLADRAVGGGVRDLLGDKLGYLAHVSLSLALALLLVHYLYKKKIFLRL